MNRIFVIQNQSAIANVIRVFADTLQGFITLAGLLTILATLGPVLVIVLAIGVIAMLVLFKSASKSMIELMQRIVPINRVYGYYIDVAMEKAAQKDLRLYKMDQLVTEKVVAFSEKSCDEFDKANRLMGIATGGMAVVTELTSAFTY